MGDWDSNVLLQLFTNLAFIIPICAWALAQFLKVMVVLFRERILDWHFMVRSGGMPSSHTALVASLATVIALRAGLGTISFAIAAILAMIVMYDAAGVRRAVGRQAILLNQLLHRLAEKHPSQDKEMEHRVRELIGHTPYQVFSGAALGVFFAWLWIFIADL
jgi:acid phosphatase family membrane protein YuiD